MSTELYSNAHVDMFDFEGPLLLKLRALAEKQRRKEREQQLSDVFSMLVQTLRAKDEQLYRHSSRVMYFTQHLSQLLSLRPGTITMINLGALFHDIGKIGLSNTLLHKASRLTEQ